MTHAPIHILGAGLTGLSTARHLGEGYALHEAAPRVGGHAVTDEEDGFRFDRTGHLLHLRDPEIRAWVERLLQGRMLEVRRRSVVYSHGRYTRYPYQANTYGLEPEIAYECLLGFVRANEARSAASGSPEPASFEAFCERYFGDGFSRHFMIPYNRKLWGVHPREITAGWCQRFVPKPTLEDVLAGAVGLNDRELGYNASFLYPRTGIGELAEAMHRELAVPANLNARVRAVDFRRRTVVVGEEAFPYRALVSTLPLDSLIGLLVDAPPEIAALAGRLRCTRLWYLDVAVDEPARLEHHWVYVPEERYPFYRVGCYTNFSPEMAPAGKATYYVELADRSEPDLRRLQPEIARYLVEMGFVSSPDRVAFARARCLEHAYVIYDHAFEEVVPRLHAFLREQDIFSTGRYGDWNYSSMEDALRFGRTAAELLRGYV